MSHSTTDLFGGLIRSRWLGALLAGALASTLPAGEARAGEFVVQPVRVDLGPTVRSSAVAVRNEGKDALSFQIKAVEWTHDASGADSYAETGDVVVFPRLMTVEPDQQGVIRIGMKSPVVSSEKTFRIFIEELPGNVRKQEAPGFQVAVLMRVGIPVFVAPARPQDGLEIEAFSVQKGTVTLSARNSGNRHHTIRGIRLQGTDTGGREVYALTLADRYLLTGSAKNYTASIPAQRCAGMSNLSVEVETDRTTAKRAVSVTPDMCP